VPTRTPRRQNTRRLPEPPRLCSSGVCTTQLNERERLVQAYLPKTDGQSESCAGVPVPLKALSFLDISYFGLDVLVFVLGVVEQESDDSFVLSAAAITFAFAVSESPHIDSFGIEAVEFAGSRVRSPGEIGQFLVPERMPQLLLYAERCVRGCACREAIALRALSGSVARHRLSAPSSAGVVAIEPRSQRNTGGR